MLSVLCPLYEKATNRSCDYLVVDHHPQIPEEIYFCFNILIDEPVDVRVLQPIRHTESYVLTRLIERLKHMFVYSFTLE